MEKYWLNCLSCIISTESFQFFHFIPLRRNHCLRWLNKTNDERNMSKQKSWQCENEWHLNQAEITDQFKLNKYFKNLYKSVCVCFRRKLCGIASWQRSNRIPFNSTNCTRYFVDIIECRLVLCANTRQITDIIQHQTVKRIEMNDNCTLTYRLSSKMHTSPLWIDVSVIYRIQISTFNRKSCTSEFGVWSGCFGTNKQPIGRNQLWNGGDAWNEITGIPKSRDI